MSRKTFIVISLLFIYAIFFAGCPYKCAGCMRLDENEDYCNCPKCSNYPECFRPECPNCICPEIIDCPECPEIIENQFLGEYVFVSMVQFDIECDCNIELPIIENNCLIAPDGNVVMVEEDGFRWFDLHFRLSSICDDGAREILEEFYISGEYVFDANYLFLIGTDFGEIMWFNYSFFILENRNYLQLLPQWEEEDGSRTDRITLERIENFNK